MTFLILTDDTKHVNHRSNIRTACDPSAANLCLDPLNDKTLSKSIPPVLRSLLDKLNLETLTDHGEMVIAKVPLIDINDLVRRTFLMPEEEDGQQHRARTIQAIGEHEKELEKEPAQVKFMCSINDNQREKIITYNDILSYLDTDIAELVWKFKRITAHQGPLT
jgi:hypothetical protein